MDKLNLLHKFLLITLGALFVVNQSVLSRIQEDLHDALPELRIKNEVLKQGTGEPARVTVTLRDGRVINGYIDRITEYGFVLMERATDKEVDLSYRIVKEVVESDSGDGLIASRMTVAARVVEGFARGAR